MSWRRSVMVIRYQGGQYIHGTWQEGIEEKRSIQASVQPITGHELISLPQGRQAQARYRLYTDTKLHTVTTNNPDKVVIDEQTYEVLTVAAFQSNVINHYRIIVGNVTC